MTDAHADGPGAARERELADRLAEVHRRIDAACREAGRPREQVHLVVVTKFFPATDVAALARLGVRDVAESRDQEAGEKLEQVERLEPVLAAGLRRHFVGQLQTNKAGHVARYADVVQSVDRARLVDALGRGAQAAGRRLDVLLQADLGGPDSERRGGAPLDELDALAERVEQTPGLRLRGVMAVAPRGEDPAPAFARLAAAAERLRVEHPQADVVSAGMSGDLEQAVAAGATHLRVGSAILGARSAPRYR